MHHRCIYNIYSMRTVFAKCLQYKLAYMYEPEPSHVQFVFPCACVDVNECTDGTPPCDTNAACENTDGSYTCTCNDGYTGDGQMGNCAGK